MGIPYAEVIGDPIAHTKSPTIHKFWLGKLGIGGNYRATRVRVEELPAYIESRRSDPDWRGCNVTMPHKRAIAPLLDRADDQVVNCVHWKRGELVGFNSDQAGVDEIIAEWDGAPEEARICIIGAGGAAWAAVRSLDMLCYLNFDIIVRDPAKGRVFLESFQLDGGVFRLGDAEAAMAGRFAIINASPLGLIGYPVMPETVLRGLHAMCSGGYAFDMVTAPVRTPFLKRASTAGLGVHDGLAMLIGQARSAFHAFFGALPPSELDFQLRKRLNP